MKDPQKHEDSSPVSSGLFVLMSTADSGSSYRDLFDRYWKKREEERARPPEGSNPTKRRGGAQRSARRPQESRGREHKTQGRVDHRQAEGGAS